MKRKLKSFKNLKVDLTIICIQEEREIVETKVLGLNGEHRGRFKFKVCVSFVYLYKGQFHANAKVFEDTRLEPLVKKYGWLKSQLSAHVAALIDAKIEKNKNASE